MLKDGSHLPGLPGRPTTYALPIDSFVSLGQGRADIAPFSVATVASLWQAIFGHPGKPLALSVLLRRIDQL